MCIKQKVTFLPTSMAWSAFGWLGPNRSHLIWRRIVSSTSSWFGTKNMGVTNLLETQQSYLKRTLFACFRSAQCLLGHWRVWIQSKSYLFFICGVGLVCLFPWPCATYVLPMLLTLNSISCPSAIIQTATFCGLLLAGFTSFIQMWFSPPRNWFETLVLFYL